MVVREHFPPGKQGFSFAIRPGELRGPTTLVSAKNSRGARSEKIFTRATSDAITSCAAVIEALGLFGTAHAFPFSRREAAST
jgi:hypothetical protein